jgi:hypothetical protein
MSRRERVSAEISAAPSITVWEYYARRQEREEELKAWAAAFFDKLLKHDIAEAQREKKMSEETEPHVMTEQEIQEFERLGEASIRSDPNWITSGWSRKPNTGEWVELGASKGITVDPPPLPPQLGIHDVAAELNKREAEIKHLRGQLIEVRLALESGLRAIERRWVRL